VEDVIETPKARSDAVLHTLDGYLDMVSEAYYGVSEEGPKKKRERY